MYQVEMHEREMPSEQDTAQPDPGKYLDSGKYLFVLHPCGRDFYWLAQHIATAPPEMLHPALWQQRAQVAQRLRQMGEEAEREEHQAAYHALRLLIW